MRPPAADHVLLAPNPDNELLARYLRGTRARLRLVMVALWSLWWAGIALLAWAAFFRTGWFQLPCATIAFCMMLFAGSPVRHRCWPFCDLIRREQQLSFRIFQLQLLESDRMRPPVERN